MQISAENLQEELDLRHVENRQIKKELEKVNSRLQARKNSIYRRHNENYSKRRRTSLSTPSSTIFHRKTRSKQTDRRMAQRRHYTSEICGICKSNRNGKKRMCIDYRKLNQKLVKDKFPLPIIEDVSDTLQEAKVYSTLDLRNGFFHVDVDEDCRKYTSFIVPDGQFEFNKVPFGLSTSPGVFQRYVSSIVRDLTRKGIV
ncbi:retrovirus-related Pol polyprotein from transposon 412 [Trichonephila clavipes]|nr:retrovirus-related Pol polyprotein from transposon 412 [Trichonephila clavipes]